MLAMKIQPCLKRARVLVKPVCMVDITCGIGAEAAHT